MINIQTTRIIIITKEEVIITYPQNKQNVFPFGALKENVLNIGPNELSWEGAVFKDYSNYYIIDNKY